MDIEIAIYYKFMRSSSRWRKKGTKFFKKNRERLGELGRWRRTVDVENRKFWGRKLEGKKWWFKGREGLNRKWELSERLTDKETSATARRRFTSSCAYHLVTVPVFTLTIWYSITPDLKPIFSTNPVLRSVYGYSWTASTDFGLGPDYAFVCFSFFFYIIYFCFCDMC